MPTYTVISQTSRMGLAPLTASPLCAIPGRVYVAGSGLHVAYPVAAGSADEAIVNVANAIAIVGGVPEGRDEFMPGDTRWTVIGTADNGVCSSWNVVAVVAGEHEVCGGFDSMLSHRWSAVVDAPDAEAAEQAGWAHAAKEYEESWN
jgi:hypothetical protein